MPPVGGGVGDDTSGATTTRRSQRGGLCGDGAERAGETRPGIGIWMGAREMQDDPPDGADHVHADRNEGLPESRDLRAA